MRFLQEKKLDLKDQEETRARSLSGFFFKIVEEKKVVTIIEIALCRVRHWKRKSKKGEIRVSSF